MPRFRPRSDTEWQWREHARQAHEARERRARWETTRAAEELVWLLHRLRFHCEQCGVPSAGPFIENEGSPFYQEIVNWDLAANLWACGCCGAWLCRGCGCYIRGVGWRCLQTSRRLTA